AGGGGRAARQPGVVLGGGVGDLAAVVQGHQVVGALGAALVAGGAAGERVQRVVVDRLVFGVERRRGIGEDVVGVVVVGGQVLAEQDLAVDRRDDVAVGVVVGAVDGLAVHFDEPGRQVLAVTVVVHRLGARAAADLVVIAGAAGAVQGVAAGAAARGEGRRRQVAAHVGEGPAQRAFGADVEGRRGGGGAGLVPGRGRSRGEVAGGGDRVEIAVHHDVEGAAEHLQAVLGLLEAGDDRAAAQVMHLAQPGVGHRGAIQPQVGSLLAEVAAGHRLGAQRRLDRRERQEARLGGGVLAAGGRPQEGGGAEFGVVVGGEALGLEAGGAAQLPGVDGGVQRRVLIAALGGGRTQR